MASISCAFPYVIISNPYGTKSKLYIPSKFNINVGSDVISEFTTIIQNGVKASDVSTWINNCSLAQSVWNDKLKKRKVNTISSQEGVEEISPQLKKTKKLAPDKNASF